MAVAASIVGYFVSPYGVAALIRSGGPAAAVVTVSWSVLSLLTFLDLVALGTIADLVPLLGENRILVTHGLTQLASTDRPGIRALAEVGALLVDGSERDEVRAGDRRRD